jgi:SNF2 family DNA or RNA helicase
MILAKNAIVVTTYATLSSDATYHKNKSKDTAYCPPCEQISWWRIICDESHTLKGQTGQTGSVLDLCARNKWCVTGTPFQTSVLDIKNQLKFVGIEQVEAMFGSVFAQTTLKKIRDRQARGHRRRDYTYSQDSRRLGHFTFFMRSVMMRHSMTQKYKGTATGKSRTWFYP